MVNVRIVPNFNRTRHPLWTGKTQAMAALGYLLLLPVLPLLPGTFFTLCALSVPRVSELRLDRRQKSKKEEKSGELTRS